MDPLSTSSPTNSMSSLVDMEVDVRMAEDADSSDSANIDIGIQKSKFWDLPLEVRDIIYGMAYPIRVTDVPTLSEKFRERLKAEENRDKGTIRKGSSVQVTRSPWANMLVSKRWYFEGMSFLFRYATLCVHTRHLLSLEQRSRSTKGISTLRYARNIRVRIGIRDGAEDLGILRKLCPEIRRLEVIFDRTDTHRCHHSIEMWPTGEAESSIGDQLSRFKHIWSLKVAVSACGRKHVCAHCWKVVDKMADYVLHRVAGKSSMRARRTLRQG